MLDILFTAGQTASALLLFYGAFLVLWPASKAAKRDDELVLLRHLRNDA